MATKRIIPIFGGAYEATEDGEIYSLKRKERRLLVGVVKASGYRMVVITVGHKKQYHDVHRIIAKAFIPNPANYREVNHKDGNKLNYEKATEIRELYRSGNYTQREIAALFNVGNTKPERYRKAATI